MDRTAEDPGDPESGELLPNPADLWLAFRYGAHAKKIAQERRAQMTEEEAAEAQRAYEEAFSHLRSLIEEG